MNIRRPLLLPFSPLYQIVLAIKRHLFRFGCLKQRRLANPVISIGSVSVGGAGKTPVVMMMADMLLRRDYAVSILTRGYGRAPQTVERVVPFGDVAWFGDEPVLLAQRSGASVFVGADRYRAGRLAEQSPVEGKIAVHLLDDGFQHRRLIRDLDIVLLTQEDVHDVLLPAGNLREPLSRLRGAGVIVVREVEAEKLRSFIERLTRKNKNSPAIWLIRRKLSLVDAGKTVPSKRPLAFCGIARPKDFIQMLATSQCLPVKTVAFPDHHGYTDADISRLVEQARQHGADGFVTTEKDAVKLTPEMRARLGVHGPLIVAQLSVRLVDEHTAVFQLISMVKRLDRRSGER